MSLSLTTAALWSKQSTYLAYFGAYLQGSSCSLIGPANRSELPMVLSCDAYLSHIAFYNGTMTQRIDVGRFVEFGDKIKILAEFSDPGFKIKLGINNVLTNVQISDVPNNRFVSAVLHFILKEDN